MPANNNVSQDEHQAALDRIAALETQLATVSTAPLAGGTPESPVHVTMIPSNEPPKLGLDPATLGYAGSYTERATKRKYALKQVDADAKPYKLLTTDHGKDGHDERPLYHELTEAEFRNLFNKD